MEVHCETLRTFEQLKPGDLIELRHEVKVGFRRWVSVTTGKVVRTQRRRHGLHHERNFDDKVFSDEIIVQRDDGELTSVALDEFSILKKIDAVK